MIFEAKKGEGCPSKLSFDLRLSTSFHEDATPYSYSTMKCKMSIQILKCDNYQFLRRVDNNEKDIQGWRK